MESPPTFNYGWDIIVFTPRNDIFRDSLKIEYLRIPPSVFASSFVRTTEDKKATTDKPTDNFFNLHSSMFNIFPGAKGFDRTGREASCMSRMSVGLANHPAKI